MSEAQASRDAILRAFVFAIAYLVVLGWILSYLHVLSWLGLLAGIGFGISVFMARKWAGPEVRLLVGVKEAMAFWPWILLCTLALVSAVAYPPTMLDSLSYRLPRVLLWLHDNQVHHFLTVEDRLNFMPQVWGLATLPFIQISVDRLAWVWNFASLLAFYLAAYDWAFDASGDVRRSRTLAFLGSTSTFGVLQSCGTANDLFSGTLLVLALRFAVAFEKSADWKQIVWTVLCLCLASGTKPHFAVFGLPLMIWFFASKSKPWKAFQWKWSPVIAILLFLCSPFVSWVLNYQTYGNWAGLEHDNPLMGKGPIWNILFGIPMLFFHALQPPVNPLAPKITVWLRHVMEQCHTSEFAPRLSPKVSPVAMIDSASLGLVTSVLLVIGVVLAIRKKPNASACWQLWAMVIGIAGIFLSLSQFLPTTIGRAYCSFFFLGVPLAISGWNLLKPGVLRWCLYLCLLNGVLALVMNAGRPLWPAARVQAMLASSPRFESLARTMRPYILVTERSRVGEDLVKAIPHDERTFVALIGGDHPLLPLFRPYTLNREILFFAPHSPVEKLNQASANYVIAGGNPEVEFPELCHYLDESGKYELLMTRYYTSKISTGAESWRLYRKIVTISPLDEEQRQ